MKYIGLATVLCVLGLVGTVQADEWPHGPLESDIKLIELASLPQGLTVVHSQDTVDPTFFGPGGSQWAHGTTVSSNVGPVTIVEFGYLIERAGEWGFHSGTRTTYSAGDFEQQYGCPGGELQPGESYTNEMNQSMKDWSPNQAARWYFIGLDADGNRVKGEAEVLLVGESGC